MNKKLSIVKIDKRDYRTIAQENWGLTREEMRGKHVHHRIHVSEGGTNDPSNLYICSPWFHRWVWHDGEFFIEKAAEGGKKGGGKGSKEDKSKAGKIGGKLGAKNQKKKDKAKGGTTMGARHAENRTGVCSPGAASLGASQVNKQVWESTVDGYRGRATDVARHNKNRGWNSDLRVRVG